MRILIIAYTTYIFDARVKRHAEALAARGDLVEVICLASGADYARNGVKLLALPISRYRGHSNLSYLSSYVRFFAKASWIAARRSFRQPYDVVIVCSIPDIAVVSAIAPRLRGSRVILDIHDTMPELYRDKFPGRLGAIGSRLLQLEERASAAVAHRVIAVHDLHAARLAEAGIPRHKISVVLNAPDSRLFHPLPKCPSVPDGFNMVVHGTINRRLGLDTAIEAIADLSPRLPDLKLKVLGSGEHRPALEEKVVSLGLQSIVRFEDGVPLEQLPAALATATVGLVPNQASSATQLMLPVKMLEYARLGIPVIASRLRTIQHYFPQDAVRYFQAGSASSLAEAIEDLYSHRQKLPALAARCIDATDTIKWDNQCVSLFTAIDAGSVHWRLATR